MGLRPVLIYVFLGFVWEVVMNPKLWYSNISAVCIIPQLGVSVGTALGPYDYLGFVWEVIELWY